MNMYGNFQDCPLIVHCLGRQYNMNPDTGGLTTQLLRCYKSTYALVAMLFWCGL